MLDITRQDWEDHVREDDARGRDINDLKLAVLGDPAQPETVKHAILPTMTRLNTLMDGAVMMVKAFFGLMGALAAGVAIAHTLGWL